MMALKTNLKEFDASVGWDASPHSPGLESGWGQYKLIFMLGCRVCGLYRWLVPLREEGGSWHEMGPSNQQRKSAQVNCADEPKQSCRHIVPYATPKKSGGPVL